jgi:hypothetical protein
MPPAYAMAVQGQGDATLPPLVAAMPSQEEVEAALADMHHCWEPEQEPGHEPDSPGSEAELADYHHEVDTASVEGM